MPVINYQLKRYHARRERIQGVLNQPEAEGSQVSRSFVLAVQDQVGLGQKLKQPNQGGQNP